MDIFQDFKKYVVLLAEGFWRRLSTGTSEE